MKAHRKLQIFLRFLRFTVYKQMKNWCVYKGSECRWRIKGSFTFVTQCMLIEWDCMRFVLCVTRPIFFLFFSLIIEICTLSVQSLKINYVVGSDQKKIYMRGTGWRRVAMCGSGSGPIRMKTKKDLRQSLASSPPLSLSASVVVVCAGFCDVIRIKSRPRLVNSLIR